MRVVATNGGVSSGLWRTIAADVPREPVRSFRVHPGSPLGVAFAAWMASGVFAEWGQVDCILTERVVDEPQAVSVGGYEAG